MALLKDNKKEKAERTFSSLLGKYKNTYYGFLATSKATQNGLTLSPKPYRTRPLNLNENPVLNKEQKFLIQKIRKLNSLGLSHLAAKEVSYLDEHSRNAKVSALYISNLYKESKAYYQSHNILLKAMIQRGIYNYDKLPKEFLKTLLPKHYIDLIEASGERHKVSPYFVLSLIKQESSFNPEAISSAGARGLMQLMPKTAKQTFKRQKLYKVLQVNAFRHLEIPANNIEIGIAHINELAGKMDGSPVEVIASYNAGRNAVKSWLKRFDKSDLPIFIERITYPETRNYVKKVATNIFNYEAIYGKQSMENGVFGSPKTIFEK
jgi:soluble lytic murein transglycosylase-like protein